MSLDSIDIRSPRSDDAEALALVHALSWRDAYLGVLPGVDLERMIARRGARWWARTVRRGTPMRVLDVRGTVAGYVTYGRSRMCGLPPQGEIYELYLLPTYQGIGLGRRLFEAARRDLALFQLRGIAVRVLVDNERGVSFYESLGGVRLTTGREEVVKGGADIAVYGWT